MPPPIIPPLGPPVRPMSCPFVPIPSWKIWRPNSIIATLLDDPTEVAVTIGTVEVAAPGCVGCGVTTAVGVDNAPGTTVCTGVVWEPELHAESVIIAAMMPIVRPIVRFTLCPHRLSSAPGDHIASCGPASFGTPGAVDGISTTLGQNLIAACQGGWSRAMPTPYDNHNTPPGYRTRMFRRCLPENRDDHF